MNAVNYNKNKLIKHSLKNKYWSNKKMNLNAEKENDDKIEAENIVEENSGLKTVSEEEDDNLK